MCLGHYLENETREVRKMDIRMVATRGSGIWLAAQGFFGGIYVVSYDLQLNRIWSLGTNAWIALGVCFVSLILGFIMISTWTLDA